MFILAKITQNDLAGVKDSDKPVVFLGGDCSDNSWREGLMEAFPQIEFLDPYDPDWDPEENIYTELAAAAGADYCLFYKGGKGTAREQKFLDYLGYGYEAFDDLDPLKTWLAGLEKPTVRKASRQNVVRTVASVLRDVAAKSYPFADVGADKVIINDFDAVPDDVWEKYARAMLALDYDYRGAKDAKELTRRSLKGDTVTLSGDHAKAFKQAMGVKDLYKPTGTPKSLAQKAIKEFGVTDNPVKAGYILQDGQMLNMSEQGGRTLDHRSIERIFTDVKWTDAMRKFMAMGNIRLEYNGRSAIFDIRTRPTSEQKNVMRRIIREEQPGEVVVDAAGLHKEYPRITTGMDEFIIREIEEAF